VCQLCRCPRLESEEQQESHHETEQTHSLGEGKAQDGEGEELAFQGRVASVADHQTAEHTADAST